MLSKYRVRKAGNVFVAKQGESDFVTARGFTHKRHIEDFAKQRRVDASALFDAVASHGLEIAQKWVLTYGREDGQWREITLSAPTKEQAVEVATRRMHEQYGNGVFEHEQRERDRISDQSATTPEAQQLRDNPGMHQDNYTLQSVRQG